MRALFLSGVVLVTGALIAQQAVADGGPHRGPSGNHGGSIELAAHHGPHYPGHAGPRYDYRGPRHLPPPPPHYRRPVVVYPPLYAYPAYGPYYYPGCQSYYYGYGHGGLQIYTGRVGVSIGF